MAFDMAPDADTSVLGRALEAASHYFGGPVTRAEMRARSKSWEVSHKRFFVMAWMRWYDPKDFSYPKIAYRLRLKDHTSALHGIRRAAQMYPDAMFEIHPGPGRDFRAPPFATELPIARSGAGFVVAVS